MVRIDAGSAYLLVFEVMLHRDSALAGALRAAGLSLALFAGGVACGNSEGSCLTFAKPAYKTGGGNAYLPVCEDYVTEEECSGNFIEGKTCDTTDMKKCPGTNIWVPDLSSSVENALEKPLCSFITGGGGSSSVPDCSATYTDNGLPDDPQVKSHCQAACAYDAEKSNPANQSAAAQAQLDQAIGYACGSLSGFDPTFPSKCPYCK